MKKEMKKTGSPPPISAAVAGKIDKLLPEIFLTQKANTDFLKSISVAAVKLEKELEGYKLQAIPRRPPPPPVVMIDAIIAMLPKIFAQQKAITVFNRDIIRAGRRYEAELKKIKKPGTRKGKTVKKA